MKTYADMQRSPFLSSKVFTKLILLAGILNFFVAPLVLAEEPLWTAEDVFSYPTGSIEDVSNDGKYSLILASCHKKGLQKDKCLNGCILINNKTLEKRTFNNANQSCLAPKFIGDGKNITYILQDKKTNVFTLYVEDIDGLKKIKVQDLGPAFIDYTFAPDAKSYAILKLESAFDEVSQKIQIEQQEITQKTLYLQKVNDSFQPIEELKRLNPSGQTLDLGFRGHAYTWAPDSKKIAFKTSESSWRRPPQETIHVLDLNTWEVKKVASSAPSMSLIFSPNGKAIAFINGRYGETKPNYKLCEGNLSAMIEVIDIATLEKKTFPGEDVWDLVGWADDNNIIITKQHKTKNQLYKLDLKDKNLNQLKVTNLPFISKAVISQNQKYLGFQAESLNMPLDIYIANMNDKNIKKITSFAEQTNLNSIQAEAINWKSFDGLEIEGILVYPQGYKNGDKIPLIVLVHGGPEGVQSQRFIGDTWFGSYSPAVFSSNGYATFVPNYRGSMGYGTQFRKRNYQDIGGGDFKDIMSGIDNLILKKTIGPNQLFITGQSYGGFMAAWAISHTNRFKAAVVEAGIVDWIVDVSTSHGPTSIENIFGGYYWDNYELYQKSSPISYVKNIQTPTLIMHGEQDLRVSPIQSWLLYYPLQRRSIPSKLVLYRGEGHGLSKKGNIIDAMKRTLGWFNKCKK